MTQNEKPAAGRAAGFERDAASGRNLHSQNSHLIRKNQLRIDGDDLLRAALKLAGAGLRPVPMRTSAKRPALRGWREATSLDADAVAATFQTARYADGLAIATGGGVFVVDLDRGHARDVDGVASFKDMIAHQGAGETLAPGPRVRTPSGGVHLYFASPPGRRVRNRTALAPGVDVRGEGGLAMAPPSARNGVPYRWALGPWEREFHRRRNGCLRLSRHHRRRRHRRIRSRWRGPSRAACRITRWRRCGASLPPLLALAWARAIPRCSPPARGSVRSAPPACCRRMPSPPS